MKGPESTPPVFNFPCALKISARHEEGESTKEGELRTLREPALGSKRDKYSNCGEGINHISIDEGPHSPVGTEP